jgi:arabinan endo-1,5-alpha-L-arabinosidase
MKRRDFLRNGLVGLGTLFGTQLASFAQDTDGETPLELQGAIRDVHDPVIIKHEDYYYLFCTGVGIPVRRSLDLQTWRVAPGGTVFQSEPQEAFAYVEGATNIWAPDISFYNGKYHIYYSVSTFGSNRSAIGLATNTTLNRDNEDFEWVDQGIVITSDFSDNWNAIDANLILDTDGMPWLVFGSHWSGIKMIRLDLETGKQSIEDDTLYSVASRAVHPRAVEAPFIVYNEGYYYLFVSFDQCCQGINSTYNVRVGRSEAITGPYVDREGVDMMNDGGTQITFSSRRYRGPGHNAVLREADKDYIVYHAYDAVQGGTPTLRIDPIVWEEDGFPSVVGQQPEE